MRVKLTKQLVKKNIKKIFRHISTNRTLTFHHKHNHLAKNEYFFIHTYTPTPTPTQSLSPTHIPFTIYQYSLKNFPFESFWDWLKRGLKSELEQQKCSLLSHGLNGGWRLTWNNSSVLCFHIDLSGCWRLTWNNNKCPLLSHWLKRRLKIDLEQ